MSTNPSAWNIEAYVGSTPIALPSPRELYEQALVRMKAGETIEIGANRYKVVNKDATSAASIENRRYRVNFVRVANASEETTSPEPNIPTTELSESSNKGEPIFITKTADGLIKFSWLNTETFATAFLAVGDILRYRPTSTEIKIVAIEYYRFEGGYFYVGQYGEELK